MGQFLKPNSQTMAVAGSSFVRVAIFLLDQSFDLSIERNATISQLRSAWHQQIGAEPSVAFFLPGERYLPEDWTLARVQLEDGGRRVLELQAEPKATFRLQLFGFPDSTAEFEAAPQLTPTALRQEMSLALGSLRSGFRLFAENEEVDLSAPFSEIREGSLLVLDPQVRVQITSRPVGSGEGEAAPVINCHSSTTVGDLRRLQQMPDSVALAVERPRRVLQESMIVGHLVVSEVDLAAPIQLVAVQRQEVGIPVPEDGERRSSPCLLDDVVRRVSWAAELVTEVVDMPARSPKEIVCREALVPHNTAMEDLVENDNALITVDPLKVVLHDNKRLRICRLPRGSTYADLHAQFRAWRGSDAAVALETGNPQRVELEAMSLVHLSKVETHVEAQLGQRTYHCWFQQPSVTFSDLIVSIGRQAAVMPRQLLRKQLFCRGCGRQVTREEEKFQAIPAACCRVRSLKLSDRRVKDAGSQTEVVVVPQREVANVSVGSSYATRTVSSSILRHKTNVSVGSSYATRTVSSSIPRHKTKVSVGSSYATRTVSSSIPRHKAKVSAGSPCKTRTVSVTYHDSNADVPVRVRLPNGLQTGHFVRPHDTTASLVTAMRRLRPDLAIGDVSWGDRWLTSAANWEQQCLTSAWGLQAGAQLLLHGRPVSLRLSVWNPYGDEEVRTMKLGDEHSAGEALEKAKQIFHRVWLFSEGIIINGQELVHEVRGRRRRSIKCFDPLEKKYSYIDLETGWPAEVSSSRFIVRRYLSATSALPATPLDIPTFIIETSVALLQLTEERQLKDAADGAMHDARFVALMEGVRCPGKFLSREKVFWRLAGGGFVDSSSGALFPDEKELPDKGERSFVILLLRRGNRPPFCRCPEGKFLHVLRRTGVPVFIQGGRLWADQPVQPCDMERWLLPYHIDDFQTDFTASAGQK